MPIFNITSLLLFIVTDMSENNENYIYCNKSALLCLLNVINFIRHQQESPLQ